MEESNVSTTLILYSKEEGDNLVYYVEIEEQNKERHNCFCSENYIQALTVAKRVYDKLTGYNIGDVGVMIEAHQGRGVTFDVNNFSFDSEFNDQEDFYKDIVSEFESFKVIDPLTSNELFRKLVRQHKLNEYQEQRFLQYIKELNKDNG